MKSKILLSLIAFASLMMVLNLSFISADILYCNPTMKIVNQDPIPAVPGDYVKVVFELSDLSACKGFAVKLNPEYPFSLDSSVNAVQTIENNPYAVDSKTTWMIPYKIRVADDAIEGDYNLKLVYHEGVSTNFDSSIKSNFNISITDSQTDFDVVIQDVSGSSVSLGVVNTGKNLANSLVVSIPKQDGFMTSGVSKQILGNLAAGDYSTLAFSISSTSSRNASRSMNFTKSSSFNYTNIPLANQILKVQIDYTDGIGKRRTLIKEISTDNLFSAGNFTSARGQFASRTQTTTGISMWWYLAGIILALIIIFKYQEVIFSKIKSVYSNGFKKKEDDSDPSWVASERKSRKK